MSTHAKVAAAKVSQDQISDAEWEVRVDLAAVYRLINLHGWDDVISPLSTNARICSAL